MNSIFSIVFGVFLILYSSYSLSRREKPLSSVDTMRQVVGVIGIIVGISTITISGIEIVWKIVIGVVVIAAGLIIIFQNSLKKIVVRSPFTTRKRFEIETANYTTKSISYECDVDVYSKTQLQRMDALLSQTKNEIYFLGLTLESLRQVSASIEDALKNNRKIRVLFLRPKQVFDEMVERLTVTSHFSEGLSRTTYSLTTLCESLTTAQKENLEVRMHDEIPSFSMILIDPYIEGSRYIQIEPYPFGISSEERKVFVLSKNTSRQKEVIDTYLQAFNSLWNTAKHYNV